MDSNPISINGKIVLNHHSNSELLNRSFCYGDGFFESIAYCKGQIPLWEYHCDRIKKSAAILGFNTVDTKEIYQSISKLIDSKKNSTDFVRIRLSIFRKNGGLYSPENNDYTYIITASKAGQPLLHFYANNYTLGLYSDNFKNHSTYSFIKSSSATFFVLAAIAAKKSTYNDFIILNNKRELCETIAHNIFIVKNNQLYTPPLSSGAVAGCYRDYVISKSKTEGIIVSEIPLSIADLNDADEVFLTNAIKGMQSVSAFNDSYYEKHFSRFLFEQTLNFRFTE